LGVGIARADHSFAKAEAIKVRAGVPTPTDAYCAEVLGGEHMDMEKLTPEKITAMQNVDIRTVDPAMLRDIRDVKVNAELPKRERILDYIRQIGNPYCYRHGKYVVKVSYTQTDVTLEERLLAYLRSKC